MEKIQITGASENNLKNIDIEIPHNKLTVVTGVSGSGKSSLVTDIIAREGQRMYLESFSAYTRSKLGKIRPARVEKITGLKPVLTVGQTHVHTNNRSTAGTFSELLPLLRNLISRYNDQNRKITRGELSFNSPKGWCDTCKGLGIEEYIDINKLVLDPSKSLRDGALRVTLPNGYTIYSQVTIDELNKVCKTENFDVDTPWNKLSDLQKDVVLNGSNKVKVLYGKHSLESRMKWTGIKAKPRDEGYYKGIIPVMEDILRRDRNDNILRFVSSKTCSQCNGSRLNQKARELTWNGKSIEELCKIPFHSLLEEFRQNNWKTKGENQLIETIYQHLKRLCDLSLGYINAERLSSTLSQGELRRMRLAHLSDNGLTGVLYIFDEPTIGLHPRDTERLIKQMYTLVENGNTVVVVEHDSQVINHADFIIEIGPGAGHQGGELIYAGLNNTKPEQTNNQKTRDKIPKEQFKICIESSNNIINQEFNFGNNCLNVVTGVSGAGKSTLLNFILDHCDEFNETILVDQKPIGRTPRSNPATYTGLFDELRKLFASTPEAKAKKLNAGAFSFNSKQGQCDFCNGTGIIKTGMHLFDDLVQVCPECNGKQYKNEILEINLKGKSMYDVLKMTVSEALVFFKENNKITRHLETMNTLGLGYLTLGQSSTTLSGGEAQRIKLVKFLSTATKSNSLILLDEPTTGLSQKDVTQLLSSFQEFTKKGFTIIVVEHDQQVIKQSDWIVDIGPESGEKGGKCLFCGTPEMFAAKQTSPTAQYLNCTPEIHKNEPKQSKYAVDLKGIKTNNLKNIDIKVDKHQMIAFTGVSGSGKTSLLIDTIYAEAQRIFTENMSTFKRNQIKIKNKADIEKTNSIVPAIAVEADFKAKDIRSTVATLSGVGDLVRLLFSRFATSNTSEQKPTSADFSPQNEFSACKTCEGSGFIKQCDTKKLIKHPDKPLLEGVDFENKTVQYFFDPNGKFIPVLKAMAQKHGIDLSKKWNTLPPEEQNKILRGTGDETYEATWSFKRKNNQGTYELKEAWPGFNTLIEEEYSLHFQSARGKHALELLSDNNCNACKGFGLADHILSYKIDGHHIGDFLNQSIEELLTKITSDIYSTFDQNIIRSLKQKLQFLNDAGIGYLKPSQPALWLSSGELKWLRLANLLSSSFEGMSVILDEPSSGLDKNGKKHLLNLLHELKKTGNTILFSDHDPMIIGAADRIIEVGPSSGAMGGKITNDVSASDYTKITSQWLGGERQLKRNKPKPGMANFEIKGIKHPFIHHGINIIRGKTGSGKTRLINQIAQNCRANDISVIHVTDHIPQGQSNSTIATWFMILNDLKRSFGKIPELKEKGFTPADFSYNSKKWQCKTCKGHGYIKTTLDFLPEIKELCPDCDGKRFQPEILEFETEGKNISQWLETQIGQLGHYSLWNKKTEKIINLLASLDLGHIPLGQEISSLSTGERKRLWLAYLLNNASSESIILYDEPTRGLHPENIQKLVNLFDRLTKQGHTIIVADNHELLESVSDRTIKKD